MECTKLHLRPQDTTLSFDRTLRDMVIQWSLHTKAPDDVAEMLRAYAVLVSTPEYPFRKVLDQMIQEANNA